MNRNEECEPIDEDIDEENDDDNGEDSSEEASSDIEVQFKSSVQGAKMKINIEESGAKKLVYYFDNFLRKDCCPASTIDNQPYMIRAGVAPSED